VYEQAESGAKGRVVGIVTLMPLQTYGVQFSDHLVSADATGLNMELGYMFLYDVWGRGYAPEAVAAMLDVLREAPKHWLPSWKINFYGVIRPANKASRRVMEKIKFREVGEHVWSGPIEDHGEKRENRVIVFINTVTW
jgi:RimJ/RimL family protein N-acetyltransferase